ncbi:MAG: Ribosome hibernation promotion factor [Chlamydiia bacterium]|nr:Ribosome hibernation promotion factor [Chlamydiia bacterium]
MAEGAEKFYEDDISVSILGRNVQVTAPMREHVHLKMDKIREMCPPATSIKVYFEVQREDHKAEIIFNFSHFHVMVHATTHDLYQSFDQCCLKLKAKLRKWKTKIQEHHNKSISSMEIDSRVMDRKKEALFEINDMIEEENFHEIEEELHPLNVLHTGSKKVPMLTVDEAAMRFDLSGEPFLVYREEKDQKLKVMCYDKGHELTVLELE